MADGGTLGLPSDAPSTAILGNYPQFEVGAAPGYGGPQVDIAEYDSHTRWVNKQITYHEPHFMGQREKMGEAWKFFDGHQLSDADLRELRSHKRPDTAINELQKFIEFASGLERRTRQALLFFAVTPEDQGATVKGELGGKLYEYFCRKSQADFERSRAFLSKLVAGLAVMDYGITRVTDPAGAPRANYCDAKEFLYPKCSKECWGLDTSSPIKWIGRETFMDVEEAVRKWPDSAIFLRSASGGVNEDQFPDFGKGAHRPINYVVPWIQTEPLNKGGAGDQGKPGKVKILEFQHWEDQAGVYFYDPIQRDSTWLNRSDFNKLRQRYRLLFRQEIADYDKQDHRVFFRSYFLNRRILLQEPRPLTNLTGRQGYTWNVMTGIWDHHDEVWIGKLQMFIAPQRYANAMFRQVLEVLGSSHKNGLFAETGAMTVAQKRDYEDRGAYPGSVNMVQPGAISGNKILPKNLPQLPQGSMEVLSFCMDMMEKMSGLSMSLMGQDQSNTPGVSLRRRMTSGMIMLAAEFDGLTRFRKREGYMVMELMKLIADDRWIRIGGQYDAQAIQLTKDPFAFDYDIELDEIDQDPNLRQYYTDQIFKIAPILARLGYFIPEVLDYANLPAQFVRALKQGIQRTDQEKQQMAMQGVSAGGRGKPRGVEDVKTDNMLKQARSLEHVGKAVAAFAKPGQERLRTVFDAVRGAHDIRQQDQKMSLEQWARLFEAFQSTQQQPTGARE